VLGDVGDQRLKDERLPEDGKDVEEDNALLISMNSDEHLGIFYVQTFLGKSGCWVKRLRMSSTSAMAKVKRESELPIPSTEVISQVMRVQNANFISRSGSGCSSTLHILVGGRRIHA
jgi:hypothetical protein